MRDLDDAYGDLCSLTNDLSAKLLYATDHVFLPHYMCDNIEHMDSPICPPAEISQLTKFWNERRKELETLEANARGVVEDEFAG